MPLFKNEITTFRHRGYKGQTSGTYVMLFGEGIEPTTNVLPDGTTEALVKEWDHTVSQTIQVSDTQTP